MIHIEASLGQLLYDSKRFFTNTRYIHIILAVFMLGTGIAALVLSLGSNGTAQVPYYFSAFVSGPWHIIFCVICQVCIHYLAADDGRHSFKASPWISAYSVISCVFVLFNVMGVVFTVVNGICIQQMMCYYDKYTAANRTMAIVLILEHCVSVILSVFLAKKSHLIHSQLNEDVGIKLNIPFDFLHFRSRRRSEASGDQTEVARNEQTTPTDKQPDLTEVQVKGGHTLTTVEISAMRQKTHRRSKSQPNMLKQLGLKPAEGDIFSIYSDSESKVKEAARKKRRFSPLKSKSNRVEATILIKAKIIAKSGKAPDWDISDEDDTSLNSAGTTRPSVNDTTTKLRKFEKQRQNVRPISSQLDDGSDDDDDIFHVKPVTADEDYERRQAILKKQEKLHREQERLFQKQRKLFQVQQGMTEPPADTPPPAYEDLSVSEELMNEETKSYNDDEDVVL